MNSRQNAKLNMAQRVLEVFKRYETVCNTKSPMVAAVATLKDDVENIRATQTERVGVNIPASSLEKKDAKTLMVELCMEAVSSLYIIGFENEHKELITLYGISEYSFYSKTNNAILALAKQILVLAKKYATELIPYGIDAAELTAIEKAIENYNSLIAKPMDTIGEKKQKTTNLVQLFAKLDSTLYDKIDKLMVLFKKPNPEFYDEYRTARNIIFKDEGKSVKKEEQVETLTIERTGQDTIKLTSSDPNKKPKEIVIPNSKIAGVIGDPKE